MQSDAYPDDETKVTLLLFTRNIESNIMLVNIKYMLYMVRNSPKGTITSVVSSDPCETVKFYFNLQVLYKQPCPLPSVEQND